jgi:hypothetical protein
MDERADYADNDLAPTQWVETMAQGLLTALVMSCVAGATLILASLRTY